MCFPHLCIHSGSPIRPSQLRPTEQPITLGTERAEAAHFSFQCRNGTSFQGRGKEPAAPSSAYRLSTCHYADHVLGWIMRPNRLSIRTGGFVGKCCSSGRSICGVSTAEKPAAARISKASFIFPCCSSAVTKFRCALDWYISSSSSQAFLDHDSIVSHLA